MVIAVAIMLRVISREYSDIRVDLASVRWPFLAAALFTSVLSTVLGGLVWLWSVRSLGGVVGGVDAVRIWCLATPAKYGLGAVGQYASRLYLAERLGIERAVVIGSLVVELAVIALSGSAVILVFFPVAATFLATSLPRFLLVIPVLLGLLAVVSWPSLATRGLRLLRFSALRLVGSPRPGELRAATAVMLGDWLLFGTTLFLIARSMSDLRLTLFLYVVFCMTIAILVGMIGITPMGLGVRDVTLTFLLSLAIPPGEAAAAVLLHRLATAMAELACAGIAICAPRAYVALPRPFRTQP